MGNSSTCPACDFTLLNTTLLVIRVSPYQWTMILLTSAQVLVFEDAANGVEAAMAAGAHCVWVPSFAYSDAADREPVLSALPPQARARVHVLESLEDFRPEQFGWPAIDT